MLKVCESCGNYVEQTAVSSTWVHSRIEWIDAFGLDADHDIVPVDAPPWVPMERPSQEVIDAALAALKAREK